MRRALFSVIGISILISIGAVAVRLLPETPPLCKDCNVVIISLDTFAAESTSLINPSQDTTPFSASLGTKSFVFDAAYAQAPWVSPSHAALFTGAYPWDLNVYDLDDPLPNNVETLAESLQKNGYQTAGFSSGAFVLSRLNYDQGFDEWEDTLQKAQAEQPYNPLENALTWISNSTPAPFFLFLRPFELYDPYTEPQTIRIEDVVSINTQPNGYTAEEARQLKNAYLAKVTEADRAVEKVYQALEARNLNENTVFIILGDHGKEFGEHGSVMFDSASLYVEALHVPLLIHVPHTKGSRIVEPVELRSVPKTVLNIIGASGDFDSYSLLPYIKGARTGNQLVKSQTIYSRDTLLKILTESYARVRTNHPTKTAVEHQGNTYNSAYSVIKGNWHVIKNFDGSTSLYNLQTDTQEQNNLGGDLLSLMQTLTLAERITVQELLKQVKKVTREEEK